MTRKTRGLAHGLRRHLGSSQAIAIGVCAAVLAVAGVASAGGPANTSKAVAVEQASANQAKTANKRLNRARKQARRALNRATRANRRARRALALVADLDPLAGPIGPIGPQGPAGIAGPPGADGAQGVPGDDGATGASVFVDDEDPGPNCEEGGVKVSSPVSGEFFVCDGKIGSDGDPGADGKTVLNGEGPPDDAEDGVDGDFYIDTAADEIFGPKAGGEWPAEGVSMKGEDGDPWTAGGTLPSGETLKGMWSMGPFEATAEDDEPPRVSISFGIPLATNITGFQRFHNPPGFDGGGSGDCPGSFTDPTAAPGRACIYTQASQNLKPFSGGFFGEDFQRSRPEGWIFGLRTEGPGEAVAHGTWAVTAP